MRSAMSCFAVLILLVIVTLAPAADPLPTVRSQRPRLIWRAKIWDGPSIEKIRGWMSRPEYKAQARSLSRKTVGLAMRYHLLDDREAGKTAVAFLKKLSATPKTSGTPTYSGEKVIVVAAVYDWMHDHPDFDDASRKKAVSHLEAWGDYYKKYLSPGVTPFYSRNTGALLGLTAIAVAIHGESEKAHAYLAHAYKHLRENTGTTREAEDGATGGGSYGHFHQFTALAHTVAIFRSGTDWDAAKWIRQKQGDWLYRQMLYQIWITYPNGWFYKDGDTWAGNHTDRYDARMHIDAITGMYKSGIGRAHALEVRKRWGRRTYYSDYVWMFYLYNNPEITPVDKSELGRAEVFSPKLHGLVCWRDSWKADATAIYFKCGDNCDHHGTYDAGKIQIFKHAPLAIKNGHYKGYKNKGYKTPKHMYYKSAWSAGVVIFDGPRAYGLQPLVDFDGFTTWESWKAQRLKFKHPFTGKLTATEANDKFARAVGNLNGATYPTNSRWTRELVYLGYKYLLILDRVTPGPNTKTRWLLHSINAPKIDAENRLATIDNGQGRLFVKTLLPAAAQMLSVGTPEKAFAYKNSKGVEYSWPYYRAKKTGTQLGLGRLDVVPTNQSAPCTYLHVLYPTDTTTAKMPTCSVKRNGKAITVTVGELTHTFKP